MARTIIVNDHYIIKDTWHGLMLLNTHDTGVAGAVRTNGHWGREEIERTQQFAKGVVVDAGANIGTHTLSYLKTADHVFAFEPQPFMFDNLCTNLLLNNIIDCTPVQCALGNFNGHARMSIEEPHLPNSPAGQRIGSGDSMVAVHTLDSLTLPKISFIKIDVETYELDVLKGARQTLLRDKPVVYVEIHYQQMIDTICSYMQLLGYTPNPLILTSIEYPPEYVASADDMTEVYGYLFMPKEHVIA